MTSDIGMLARLRAVPKKGGGWATQQMPRAAAISVDGGPMERLRTLRVTPSTAPSPKAERGPGACHSFHAEVKFDFNHHLTSALLSKMLVEYIAHLFGVGAAHESVFDVHRDNALHPSRKNWVPYYRGPSHLDRAQYSLNLDLDAASFAFHMEGIQLCIPVLPIASEPLEEVPNFVLHTTSGNHGSFSLSWEE